MKKDQILSKVMKDKRKDGVVKFLDKQKHPIQLNMLWFISHENYFCQDQMVNTENNCWLTVSPKHVPRVMKIKHPLNIMVLRAMVALYLHLSSHIVSNSTRWTTSNSWRRQCCFGSIDWLLQVSMYGNRTLHHAAWTRDPSQGCQRISVTRSFLTSS